MATANRERRILYARALEPASRRFFECGCCGHVHRLDWFGDCRDDLERFTFDDLDEALGAYECESLEDQELAE